MKLRRPWQPVQREKHNKFIWGLILGGVVGWTISVLWVMPVVSYQNTKTISDRPVGENKLVKLLPIENLPNLENCKMESDPAKEQELLNLLNAQRIKNGLQRLVEDLQLTTVSHDYALILKDEQLLTHYSKSGKTVLDRVRGLANFSVVGENLGFGSDIAAIHERLMQSKTHRENLLNIKYKRVGIGVISAVKCGVIAVETFTD